jgi:hypothetical protein
MAQLLPAMDARAFMVLEQKYGPGAYSVVTQLRAYFVPNWFDNNPVHPTYFNPGCIYLYLGLPALFAIGWATLAAPGPRLHPAGVRVGGGASLGQRTGLPAAYGGTDSGIEIHHAGAELLRRRGCHGGTDHGDRPE